MDVRSIGTLDRDAKPLRSVICTKCGLSWTDPRQNEDEIRRYYSKDYRLDYKGTYIPKRKHVLRAGIVARHRFDFVREFVKPGDRVLDVGSGGGEFVFLMRRLGFDASGIEPNKGYATYARECLGLPIEIDFVQRVELPVDSYDVITLHHVLEHLDNPFEALSKIRRAVNDEGIVVIDVPNIEGVCFSPAHRFHAAHLYNFNRENLEMLGRKAGFSVVRSELSDDGGVIAIIFRKSTPESGLSGEVPGNFDRIAEIVGNHTRIAHFLSPWPYRRPLGRLRSYLTQIARTSDRGDGKQILEKLFDGL